MYFEELNLFVIIKVSSSKTQCVLLNSNNRFHCSRKRDPIFPYTAKPVYNDHPRDPKFVAVVDSGRCSELGLCYKNLNWDSKMVVAVGRWSLPQVLLYI
jgi:hypothetical protein